MALKLSHQCTTAQPPLQFIFIILTELLSMICAILQSNSLIQRLDTFRDDLYNCEIFHVHFYPFVSPFLCSRFSNHFSFSITTDIQKWFIIVQSRNSFHIIECDIVIQIHSSVGILSTLSPFTGIAHYVLKYESSDYLFEWNTNSNL